MFASRPVHFFFNVIIPSFSLSTSTPLSLHCVLQDSLGNSRWSCDVTISLHFASFYLSYEIFTRPGGVSNSGLHYLVGYVISIKDTKEFAETSHPQCLYPSLNFSCYCPRFRGIIYNNVIWLWSIIWYERDQWTYGHDQWARHSNLGTDGDVHVIPINFSLATAAMVWSILERTSALHPG